MSTNSVIAYKGFNRTTQIDENGVPHSVLSCRGFIYEEGKTYEEDAAILCQKGFHACINPLDVFNYYDYETHSDEYTTEYHRVLLEDISTEKYHDSKICGKRITILEEVSLKEMIEIAKSYEAQLVRLKDIAPVKTCFLVKNTDVNVYIPVRAVFQLTNDSFKVSVHFIFDKDKEDLIINYYIWRVCTLWTALPTQEQMDEACKE